MAPRLRPVARATRRSTDRVEKPATSPCRAWGTIGSCTSRPAWTSRSTKTSALSRPGSSHADPSSQNDLSETWGNVSVRSTSPPGGRSRIKVPTLNSMPKNSAGSLRVCHVSSTRGDQEVRASNANSSTARFMTTRTNDSRSIHRFPSAAIPSGDDPVEDGGDRRRLVIMHVWAVGRRRAGRSPDATPPPPGSTPSAVHHSMTPRTPCCLHPRLARFAGLAPPLTCENLVGEGGLEPPRPCGHWHLKPARLPIPPLARVTRQEKIARPLPPSPHGAPVEPPTAPVTCVAVAIRGFERRLERMVEGAFARAFRSSIRPVELARRL